MTAKELVSMKPYSPKARAPLPPPGFHFFYAMIYLKALLAGSAIRKHSRTKTLCGRSFNTGVLTKMNIALVFPPFYLEAIYNMPPLGLVNIATVLKNTPHQVRIFDFPLSIRLKTLSMDMDIYRECARQVLEFEPDVAGFSVQCTTYPPSVRIAEELKKLKPGVRIVFGGHNASFVDELTLSRFPFVDAIVRGEGEISFPELIQAFEKQTSLDSVDGVTFRAGARIIRNPDRQLIEDLDSLPVSDYAFVPPLHVYRDACGIRRSIAILEVGRGCPHHCIYCSQSLIWRRKSRTFSPDRLIRDMKDLAENFGAECFLLAYDQFTAKRGFAEQFCRGVIDAGLNRLPWYCISRLDTLDTISFEPDARSRMRIDVLWDRLRIQKDPGLYSQKHRP